MCPPDDHPSPDELLAKILAEEEPQRRGALKIFLGYAAGVGKTFTMLEAARQRKKELDVVVAYVETHGRIETGALLEGLEIVPRKQQEYQGLTLTEMDLDAVLKRRPRLALVDELAHTNIPNSRHLKRYQDVDELLEAGIDVYTTLNVQHIETLRDVVAGITGAWMRETVPDSFINSANEIEIVDLPPEELIKRLNDGKVYISDQIGQATANFFRKGNLTALRELTMRLAAKHVDAQKQAYMRTHAIGGPWPTSERLLVCVSLNPSTSLIRSTYRLAQQVRAEWFAIHIETPNSNIFFPDFQERLETALRLAERLGAKVSTIQGNSIASSVVEFAVRNNITTVVLGKPRRRPVMNFFGASTEDQIMRQSKHFDVYVVSDASEKSKLEKVSKQRFKNWSNYLLGLGLVALITVFGQLGHEILTATTLVMIYLLGVVLAALFWGFGPSILVSALSFLAFGSSIIFSFHSALNGENILALMVLLFVGVIISYMASQNRQHAEAARSRERETAALYTLSKDLTVSNDLDSYVQAIISRTKETFGCDAAIFLPDPQNKELLKVYAKSANISVDEKEAATALWSFQHQKTVGHGTDTLTNARALYFPLITARQTVGVVGLWATSPESQLTIEQKKLLGAYIDLEALAIEGILMSDEAANARILRGTEALQTALLNSISHDLRTPLVRLFEALRSLREGGTTLDDAARKSLIQTASEETETLNHMITNLIDISRIDAGAVRLSRDPAKVQDMLAVALEQLREEAESRQVIIDIPPDLPTLYVDFGLIVQALVNILDNAFKYSPQHTPVKISAREVRQEIEITVADRGIGISPQDLPRVFDKFYRVHLPSHVLGTGLGLSISKGFVEAHGGRIMAENRQGGGTIITVILPIGTDTGRSHDLVIG